MRTKEEEYQICLRRGHEISIGVSTEGQRCASCGTYIFYVSKLIELDPPTLLQARRYEEYLICLQRHHVSSGFIRGDGVRQCKFCSTHWTTKMVQVEKRDNGD